ncbi:MocR-like pyridoxine biosynthesis transcription factor PdxR [Actinophytocola gossypii]|uniref:PLP-dependent aminotransferase family protein n=1 Tax=Actinophytocola gossypii TaxID=2812003 RepID=A0ABT2JB84_9PSEU|nr:PLP-dependent aminotransferase family protein [Actinophytocola gossypii]MCT2585102.1 PLP-dependent aminotransferase family protein [Actinophytocola gossypii]
MSTSSPELFVELDRSRPRGLRAQLERNLRDAIRAGRLRPGVRLPSSRTLAADLRITRGVVVAAYHQLTAEGYLTSRQGWGTVVNAITTPREPRSRHPRPDGVRHDFRPGAPDVGLFPHAAWARATRTAMRSLPDQALGYGDPAGLPALRETLADYLGRVRGVSCGPDDIVVCNGFSHGLSLLARVLASRGVAVEDPGHPSWREQLGAGCHPVEVDDEGLRVDRLAASGAGAVLVTPAHQYPTGVVLSAGRRIDLLDWARTSDAYVIEDDYDAEYRYDGHPVGALQGIAPDHVIHVGSLSKSLAPGLRLGWLVVPPALRDEVVAARAHGDGFTASIIQATVAEFVARGDLDRHLRRTRREYRLRRDALIAALRRLLPGSRATGISAGLHVLVRLPEGTDAPRLAATAARHGILVRPLDRYRFGSTRERPAALVLGYSRLTPHRIEEGIHRLATIVSGAVPSGTSGRPA